jgi:hypothetical protein
MRQNGQRIVERRNRSDDADWKPEVVTDAVLRSGAAVEWKRFAAEASALVCGKTQYGSCAWRFAARFTNRFAALARDGERVLVPTLVDVGGRAPQYRVNGVGREIRRPRRVSRAHWAGNSVASAASAALTAFSTSAAVADAIEAIGSPLNGFLTSMR